MLYVFLFIFYILLLWIYFQYAYHTSYILTPISFLYCFIPACSQTDFRKPPQPCKHVGGLRWGSPRRGAPPCPPTGLSQRLVGALGAASRRCFPRLRGAGAVAWALLPSGGPAGGSRTAGGTRSSARSLPTESIP